MSKGERTTWADARVPSQRATLGEFAQVMRGAIAERGVTLHWLHHELSVSGREASMATLLGWRSGRLVPSTSHDLVAVAGLEELLGLSPGELSSLVDVPQSLHPVATGTQTGRVGSQHLRSGAARARAALGFDQDAALAELSVSVVLDLDEQGVERSVRQRTEWIATRDGAESFPVILIVPTPATGRGSVEPLRGCRLGPEYVDLSEGVFATTVVLDRRLRAGETATTEHCTHLPSDVWPEDHYEHRVLRQVPSVEVTVRFHPARVPASVRSYTRLGDAESLRVLHPEAGVVSQSQRRFGPGAAGFRWAW